MTIWISKFRESLLSTSVWWLTTEYGFARIPRFVGNSVPDGLIGLSYTASAVNVIAQPLTNPTEIAFRLRCSPYLSADRRTVQ